MHIPSKAVYEFLQIEGLVSAVFSSKCTSLEYVVNHTHKIEMGSKDSIRGVEYVVGFVLASIAFAILGVIEIIAITPAHGSEKIGIIGVLVQYCAMVLIIISAYVKSRANLKAAILESKMIGA